MNEGMHNEILVVYDLDNSWPRPYDIGAPCSGARTEAFMPPDSRRQGAQSPWEAMDVVCRMTVRCLCCLEAAPPRYRRLIPSMYYNHLSNTIYEHFQTDPRNRVSSMELPEHIHRRIAAFRRDSNKVPQSTILRASTCC